MKRLSEYNPYGPKQDAFLKYQRVNYVEENLQGIEAEQVDEYSVALGKLFRWIRLAIQTRKEDIIARKEHKDHLREERQKAIEQDEERSKNRRDDFEATKADWDLKVEAEAAAEAEKRAKEADENGAEGAEGAGEQEEELPQFDEKAFYAEWDEKTPPIEIPPEVVDDIDNDYDGVPEAEVPAE